MPITFVLLFSSYGRYGRNFHHRIEAQGARLELAIRSVERHHPEWYFRSCVGAY
jgi:hypothetical protein